MEVEDDVVPQQFTEIEVLQNFGIQACDIKKLQAAGYHTVDRVCMTMPKKLADIKGLSDAKVAKIQEECRKLCPRFQFQSGLDVAAARQESLIRITTGSDELDHILGGGIETGSITCVFGEYRTGKSQLALTMAVACQTPMEQKGANARSIVIDTEGSFRTERIVEVAERFGLPGRDVRAPAAAHAPRRAPTPAPPRQVLANMQVARVYTPDQVEECLIAASAICRREELRLVIIDSIISPFRFEYAGRGELSERQIRLGQILRLAKKLADEFNIAVLLTNQVMADPGNSVRRAIAPPRARRRRRRAADHD